jgi:hypothetical protein
MARRKQPVIPDQLLDQLLSGADAKAAFEKDGLLDELKKALAERALNAEIDYHLESGEAEGRTNSRNGYGKCPPGDAQRQAGVDRDGDDPARGAARSAVDVRSAADRQVSEAVPWF